MQIQDYRFVEQGANVNLNGFADPGETLRLPVSLFNGGTADATSVAGNLRVLDGAMGRVLTSSAVWGDIPVGAGSESLDPHFELTVFDTVVCGDAIELELDMEATGAGTRTGRLRIPFGVPDRDYDAALPYPVSIPSVTSVPFTSTIDVTDDRSIADLDVSVNIGHFSESDLTIDLTSPEGTTVRLHDRSEIPGFGIDLRYDAQRAPDGPGTMADFVGESVLGTWTLTIEDQTNAFAGGTLYAWTLHATVVEPFDCEPFQCPESSPLDPVANLVVDRSVDGGDGSIDLTFGWEAAAGVAGYHVLESSAPAFDGVVELTGRTAGATSLLVENGAATATGLTFYVVRAVNGCNHEGP
jgi:subtilisin-like proprotein convertase family protein